jgi:fatty acid synthase subunit alpha
MQATFNGQLGKQSSSLIARTVSSKMPGGFNITAVRKYLETRWGLGSGRQDGVLLLAITMEPASRLGSEADAKAFLDDVTNKYAASAGINLSAPTAGGDAGGGGGGMMMDPAAIDALTKDQRALFKQQLEVIARYLKMDLRAGDKAFITSQETQKALQSQIDLWQAEHGDFYASGIEPSFDPLKARVYDSSWNWARQDALSMYYDIIFGRLQVVDREIVSRCIRIMNRSNPLLLDFMQYHIDNCPTERGETYQLAKELGQQLIENCKEVMDVAPVYKDVNVPTGPETTIDSKGTIGYKEVPRSSARKLEHYVKQMAEGGPISEYSNRNKVQNDLKNVYKLIRKQHRLSKSSQLQFDALYKDVLHALDMNENQIMPQEGGKKSGIKRAPRPGKVETIPFLHLKKKSGDNWDYNKKLTGIYLNVLETAASGGLTFQGKNVLMTGAGAGSIGAEVLQGLISGGAKVVVTTSRFSREVTEYYQAMYARYGARGSQLVVVPFNQGSKQDVEALVDYIYDTKKGLGWDLDFVVPFAAIPENGREIDNIDSKSELAHRIMLTNLLRMLGSVKTQKQAHGFETRPAQVVLPLSPNHGTFGNDGLYSESKLALETLFNRWYSENWGSYLTICGAVIGWTRGTGLMSGNNMVAEGVEKLGVRTFSQQEMAFNLLGLMSPAVVNLCQLDPVWADLNGGLQFIPDLKGLMTKLRTDIMETSDVRQAVIKETAIEHKVVNGEDSGALYKKVVAEPRANIKFEFPKLPEWEEVKPINESLKGMVNLDKVVVVTGFAEVGPWGNSRTRWEMESNGKFSLEGCVEMAWIMGLIKHHNGPLKGKAYSGWVDAKTGDPVDDKEIKPKYEKYILEHTGIRLIEPELFKGYDPKKKQLLQEIVIQEDLEPFEASKETAEEFKREHGDKVEIFEIPDSGEYTVRLRKGANLLIPKALQFDRLVAGQVPTGWDASRYGIPDDIIEQVDPVTLFVLVCTAESMLSAGITDPYEFYKYVHLSEVGNCIGSGIGGTHALRGMYKDRYLDKPLQKDILQESFINTMSAWVNMLLLSSTGPIKTPVGACATAVESVDIGYETIVEGKARVCFVGGFDDFQEEGSYEFANMKATSNAEDEFAHGRTPQEMSRPTTTTRAGFMESQGCGMQLIMSAQLALDMGVPIHGIIALTTTATDKIGRSVPAPGQGVLTTARENPGKFPSPLLDIKYRRRQMDLRKKQIKEWQESELLYLREEAEAMKAQSDDTFNESAYLQERAQHIEREAIRQEKDAQFSLGNNFWKQDSRIAPLRGALATWGLTVDDIDVASFHGTSTVANDKNESDVICQQLKHLGRSKGNAVMGIFQKYLTGHPKGAAGAWMFNGCLQVLESGLVPGNRNADNVDKVMEKFDYIVYPSRSIQTDGVKAFSVTSFGFGQKGAQVIGIHPKYLYATLDASQYAAYKTKVEARQKKAYRYFHNGLINNSIFVAKSKAPYEDDQQSKIFLNPDYRVSADKKTSELKYSAAPKTEDSPSTAQMVESLAKAHATENSKVGVDVENIDAVNIENETFVERNFTTAEQDYCRKAASPQSSFAGRWSAKEAVFKSLGVSSQGAGAALKDIEIGVDATGAPVVNLLGAAAAAAKAAGVKSVNVSISHSETQAVAVAVSKF